MSKKNLPNIPLYIGDWEKDCNVLTLEAEAAWLRIIFKMFTNGKQSSYKIPTRGLQNLWRCNAEKVQEIISELLDFNICEIKVEDRFTIFTSRRFERENDISKKRSDAVKSRKDRSNTLENDIQNTYKTSTKGQQITENEDDYESVNEIEVNNETVIEKKQKVDFQKVVDIFNSMRRNMPEVKKLTDSRKNAIRIRAKEYGLTGIGQMIQMANQSDFLNGSNERGWVADFDWLMKSMNFVKVYEGIYKNKTNGKQVDKEGGASDSLKRKTVEILTGVRPE